MPNSTSIYPYPATTASWASACNNIRQTPAHHPPHTPGVYKPSGAPGKFGKPALGFRVTPAKPEILACFRQLVRACGRSPQGHADGVRRGLVRLARSHRASQASPSPGLFMADGESGSPAPQRQRTTDGAAVPKQGTKQTGLLLCLTKLFGCRPRPAVGHCHTV